MRVYVEVFLKTILISYLWCACSVAQDLARSKSVLGIITSSTRLQEASKIIQDNFLTSYYEQPNITVFVPSAEYLIGFNSSMYGINMHNRDDVMSLFLYHIVKGKVSLADFTNGGKFPTMHPAGFPLTTNIFSSGGSEQVYAVNGDSTIIVSDLVGTNGIVHIIDRVIAPLPSKKTLHDYLLYPDIPNMAFISIARAAIVDPYLKDRTNSTNYQFTAFSPPDSVLFPIPAYGQDELFKNVTVLNMTIHAHLVQGETRYLSTKGAIQDLQSLQGKIRFYSDKGSVYVINNYVRARVIMANIPVANGVVHIVDNLLYFKYMNVIQQLNSTRDASAFETYIHRLPSPKLQNLTSATQKYTIFVPTNDAFAKIPISAQQNIIQDDNLRLEITENHIVQSEMIDSGLFGYYQQVKAMNDKTIYLRTINGEMYVESEGILAKVIQSDIGCTNGMIHLISNVLGVRDFTVLEAIQGNSQLRNMTQFLSSYPDVEKLLDSQSGTGQITVFLPSDVTLSEIPAAILDKYKSKPEMFLKAIEGHIIDGEVVSSSTVDGSVSKYSYGGTQLDISHFDEDFTVIGSHIAAKVVIRDIWCSNGVLHIIDNLLHLPSRNILDELKRHRDTDVITSFLSLQMMEELSKALNNENNTFTLFVPSDDTFMHMPRSRVDVLFKNTELLEKVLSAHVYSNGSRYISELFDGDSYMAEIGVIHVSRNSTDVFVINNNVKRKVIRSDIRATNGIIHVVDGLLYFPFYSLAEVLYHNARIFYDLIKTMTEFSNSMNDEGTKLTIFAPSDEYLMSLPSTHLERMRAESDILKKIFIGHSVYGSVLDSEFLAAHLKQQYNITNRYNVTFNIQKRTTFSGSSVDVGYSNLVQDLDINRKGIAGSNGVIYIINGLLDYSFLSVTGEMRKQEKLTFSLDHVLRMFPDEVVSELEILSNRFTIFMPANEVVLHLTYEEVTYLEILNETEKYELSSRHVLNGSSLTSENLRIMSNQSSSSKFENETGVQFVTRNEDIFLVWKGVEAKIIQSNILANNGMVHVLDRLLFTLEPDPTTAGPTPKNPSPVGAAAQRPINMFTILLTLALYCVLST